MLGISIAHIGYATNGLNPPHTHPRATKILVVFEGTPYVRFVASNQNNDTFFAQVLNKGVVFVFPVGMTYSNLKWKRPIMLLLLV